MKVQWILDFKESSAQIFWVQLINVTLEKFCSSSKMKKSAVTLNHSYLLQFCLRETICSQSDTAAIWECWSWMDYLLHFFLWDPVTSSHFIWGMYKMYVSWVLSLETCQALHTKTISRSASPKSTWLSCSPTVSRAFTDCLGVASGDVTRHPGKLTLCGFKSSRHTLEPSTIYREQEVDRFTNARRHCWPPRGLCCNIFTTELFSVSSSFQQENWLLCSPICRFSVRNGSHYAFNSRQMRTLWF